LKTGLVDAEDDSSVLKKNEPRLYAKLKMKSHTLGMIPKLDNCFNSLLRESRKKNWPSQNVAAEAICTSIEL
jgi:acetylglutamate kinase